MFVAGDLDSDAELIQNVATVMQAAKLGSCSSRPEGAEPVQLGAIRLRGRSLGPERPSPGPA